MSDNMKSEAKRQMKMHRALFSRISFAMENGFPLEAVFREYAAIEGRLEVIMGLLGAPCNINAKKELRRSVMISHRIECIKHSFASSPQIGNTKLDKKFFENLGKWCRARNELTHGLYKDVFKYDHRTASINKLAKQGEEYVKKLYNEAKRLRRLRDSHPEIELLSAAKCFEENCKLCVCTEESNIIDKTSE